MVFQREGCIVCTMPTTAFALSKIISPEAIAPEIDLLVLPLSIQLTVEILGVETPGNFSFCL